MKKISVRHCHIYFFFVPMTMFDGQYNNKITIIIIVIITTVVDRNTSAAIRYNHITIYIDMHYILYTSRMPMTQLYIYLYLCNVHTKPFTRPFNYMDVEVYYFNTYNSIMIVCISLIIVVVVFYDNNITVNI